MSNYNTLSGSYSGNYDYIFLNNLTSSSYSSLFRNDSKNLKIKTNNETNCPIYIICYESQPVSILVRIPTVEIPQTTKLLLDVYDTGITFSSSLSTGNKVMKSLESDVKIPSAIANDSEIRTNHISKVLSELKAHELVECINP